MEKILYLSVTGSKIKATNTVDVLSKSENWYRCSFSFDSTWEGLTKTVVFSNDKKSGTGQTLATDNTCYIPACVLQEPGYLYIGLVHNALLADGTLETLPTEWTFVTIREGVDTGRAISPPEENVYEAILRNTTQAYDFAAGVEARANAGDFTASVALGTVMTGESGSDAVITNSGSTQNAVFNFTLPRGIQGLQGIRGVQGETGATGVRGLQGETGPQGPVGLNWQGAYSAATAYSIDDAVGYNGSAYICIQTSTGNLPTNTGYWQLLAAKGDQGQTGETGAQGVQGERGATGAQGPQGENGMQGPAGLNWQGAYSAATAYAVDDAVGYIGSSYICVQASTGNLPTNATYWELLAQKGTDGEGSGDMLAATYDPTSVGGDVFSRTNHTGTQTVSTISGFDAEVSNNTDVVAATSHISDITKHIPFVTASGSANTYTVTLDGVTSYTDGLAFWVKIPASNTLTSTINLNNLGAVHIYVQNGTSYSSLTANMLRSGFYYLLMYVTSISKFILLSVNGNIVHTDFLQTLSNKTLTSPTINNPKINEAVNLTATSTELNILDGATLTTTELNYVKGATSAIQTQLDAKAPLSSPTFTGTPAAPTAANGTSTTQIATTEFVQNAVSASGGGDMMKATYDPNNKAVDAFSADNHVSGTTNKVYTATEQTKLAGIATGAEVNVNADWDASSGDAQILNKPAIPTVLLKVSGGGYALDNGSTRPTLGTNAVDLSYTDDNTLGATGNNALTEGYKVIANGDYSHAEGAITTASGESSHAEGNGSTASGKAAHTEGGYTAARGQYSHAEGQRSMAHSDYAHAEGRYSFGAYGKLYKITAYDDTNKTITLDSVSGLSVGNLLQIKHDSSLGYFDIPIAAINGLVVTLNTTVSLTSLWYYALKIISSNQQPVHAEGNNTIAGGQHSHAQNDHTIAQGLAQTAIGKYNILQGTADSYVSGDQAFIIGNGTAEGSRSNALTVDWAGNINLASGASYKINGVAHTHDIVEDTTPQLGGELDCNAHTIGCDEYNNGDSGTAKTIDWRLGNHQKVTMTANCTFTFTSPSKPCMLSLRLIQDATGSRTVTLPTMKKAGGTAFTWSTAANSIDILSIYYDGTNYYGQNSIGWA